MEKEIEKLLEAKFQEPDFQDCFVIEIALQKGNKLEVFIDADSGITFEKCQKISRYLESFIDTNGWLGEHYVLEVSSPGISRPLKFRRQYKKNLNRTLEISRKGGAKTEGKLIAVEEETIILEISVKPEGKKKAELQPIEIPFSEITKAIVKIAW